MEEMNSNFVLICSRYTAFVFAVGLAIGETILNWENWQFAPLWIVDYAIALWLMIGFFSTRQGKNLHILQSGWAFTAGVFYMALFVSIDPELAPYIKAAPQELFLMGLMLSLSCIGLVCALRADNKT